MAYTNVWNNSTPTGAEAANTIDDILRGLKLDLTQRFTDFLNIPDFTVDPLRIFGLRFGDTSDSSIFFGDTGAGHTKNIYLKDKTGAIQYAQLNDKGFELDVPLVYVSSAFPILGLYALGDSLDQKFWKLIAGTGGPGNGVFAILAVNDANNASNTALSIARTGTVINAWSFAGTKFTFNNRLIIGTDASGATCSVFGDGSSLNALDSVVTVTSASLINGTNAITTGVQILSQTSLNQVVAGTNASYASHVFTGAAHTSGTITSLTGIGIVTGVSGNGGIVTTLNALSLNPVVSTGAIITNWNGILVFAPSGAGTITNLKAINIGNMGSGNTQFAIITGTGLVQYGDELILAASTTARASIRIPSGTTPTSPSDGEMWYDGANVKFRVGATTKTFTLT